MIPASSAHPSRRANALNRAIAASMGCDAALVPLFPKLFAGLSSFGSMPRTAALWLRDRAGVRSRDTVIELACGKGAAAVAIARATGCRIVGIDAYEPFVLEARERARRAGLQGRCTFECADINSWTNAHVAASRSRSRATKAALMLGLFPLRRSIPLLASLVAPGGWCLADDAVFWGLDAEASDLTPARAQAIFERAHLSLRASRMLTPSQVHRLGQATLAKLEPAVVKLSRESPKLRRALSRALWDHREASILLQGDLRPSLWLGQRL